MKNPVYLVMMNSLSGNKEKYWSRKKNFVRMARRRSFESNVWMVRERFGGKRTTG
jgi:hypothetical protein